MNDERHGATLWLTGLPSAGKSTLAFALAARLRAEGHRVEVLDGDEMRALISRDLGYGREDREANTRRIGFVAGLLASHGVTVIVPVIAPYAGARAEVAACHAARKARYLEVHVSTPVEVCARRDVKGLYAEHASGRLVGLTGVDDPYEEPESPHLRLDTQHQTVAESVETLHGLLRDEGVL